MRKLKKGSIPAALLVAALAGPAFAAQRPAPAAQPAQPRTPATPIAPQAPSTVQIVPLEDDRGAQDTRERLRKLLDQYPPSVRQVLRIDTSLLSRPDYLATYPTLAAFLEQHPEIAHNPAYFVGLPDGRSDDDRQDPRVESVRAFRNMVDWLGPVAIIFIITSALVGVIRTLLDQYRWRRSTQLQMDMQNKLIDRFAGGNELLAYLQSPAGRGLVDIHAPVFASSGPHMLDAPAGRIFWPLQAGIVLSFAGIGLHFLGNRIGFQEMNQPISGFGALVGAIGLGFIVSAIASFFLSHRLGLVPPPPGRPDLSRGTPDA